MISNLLSSMMTLIHYDALDGESKQIARLGQETYFWICQAFQHPKFPTKHGNIRTQTGTSYKASSAYSLGQKICNLPFVLPLLATASW